MNASIIQVNNIILKLVKLSEDTAVAVSKLNNLFNEVRLGGIETAPAIRMFNASLSETAGIDMYVDNLKEELTEVSKQLERTDLPTTDKSVLSQLIKLADQIQLGISEKDEEIGTLHILIQKGISDNHKGL